MEFLRAERKRKAEAKVVDERMSHGEEAGVNEPKGCGCVIA